MITYLTENNYELPNIRTTDSMILCEPVVLIDSSWRLTDNRKSALETSPRCHILYVTTADILQWENDERECFLENTSAVLASSVYLKNLSKPFMPKPIEVLNFPVSELGDFQAKEKKKQVVAVGDSLADNIEGLTETLKLLREDWETIILPQDSPEIPDVLSKSWAYLYMSRSSEYPFHFIQAGLSSCWIFAWNYHPFANEYKVCRFKHEDEFIEMTGRLYEKSDGKAHPNSRKQMVDKHGIFTFEKSLEFIIKDIFFKKK